LAFAEGGKFGFIDIFTLQICTMKTSTKTHYRNRLPHIAPVGARLFVTYRQDDSLPQQVYKQFLEELNNNDITPDQRKVIFGKLDKLLGTNPSGSCMLRNPEVAKIVIDHLKAQDGKLYYLQAFTIMPNHVHILIDMSCQLDRNGGTDGYVQLDKVMMRHKGRTARLINELIGKTGKIFWLKDSYDHVVRNDREWKNIINYIVENPVKAKLVEKWQDWPYTYVMPEILAP
jgi:putative transposase